MNGIIILLRKNYIHYILLTSLFIGSCAPYKKLVYLKDDSKHPQSSFYNPRLEKTIQPGDKIYVSIFSVDDKTASLFSNRIYSSREEDISLYSYSVNEKGEINFPYLGLVYIKGLNLLEAQKKLEELMRQYVTNITITVRFVGNNIYLMGEVVHPGEYPFYDEKVNALQAIAYSGGITTFGDKSDITLIRESNDSIYYHKLDLTNRKITESEFFYLLPNDIIVVGATRANYRSYRDLSLLSSLLSTITTTIALISFIKSNK
jgi:polysaccharide biosynthesis/export protein